jgi:hypothetical protein
MLICSHDLRRLPCSACSADQRNTRQHLDISQHLGKAGLTRKHRAFLQLARLRGPSPTTQGSAVRTRHRPRAKVRVTLRFRARWSFYRQSLVPPNPTEIPQTCTEESLRACVSCLAGPRFRLPDIRRISPWGSDRSCTGFVVSAPTRAAATESIRGDVSSFGKGRRDE